MNRAFRFLTVSASIGMLFVALAAAPASASDWLSGAHFNLNILGGPSCGKVPSTAGGGSRHTIFVPLTTTGDSPGTSEPESTTFDATDTAIYLLPAQDFAVCTGDACAPALDCSGVALGSGIKDGAVFELPCDTIEPSGTIGACNTANNTAPALPYCVYAEALGKPGGQAQITTCALDTSTSPATEICGTNPTPVLFRQKGKGGPTVTDVTFNLTTLQCTGAVGSICPCAVGVTCNVEIFSSFFQQYLWDYDNQGLKNLQVRFYQNPAGATSTSCPVP